ncbi:MAG: carbamoyl phosphate synthase small subunit, partial [Candidatus Obscuribacterales bacterium]|nr:carbamoyl phosphate synthase small subunit [Candidatus Obscuribacterales bacterium]
EIARTSPEMTGSDFTSEVTTKKPYKMGDQGIKVAVMDFGIKQNILNSLVNQKLALTVYPADTKADEILKEKPDAIFLSNGPGDPAACSGVLAELPKLIDSGLPIFGICLGHQLLAIALGAKTFKLKFGHRGGNQPVKDLTTGKVEITSQNHGFAVDSQSLPSDLELTHINLNDNSVEGFKHRTKPIFCVQYHPEASPGPHDSHYLFERFAQLIEKSGR